MKLSELLGAILKVAKENELTEPYIVGGIPRDRAFDRPGTIKDIDVTTGNDESLNLAMACARVWPDANFNVFDDGHSSLQFKNIQLDFSNNYNIPSIEDELKRLGVSATDDLTKEVYSRDFTINTLLQPFDLSKDPLDITGKALEDVANKVLRTPISAHLTIGHDPRRILRALKLTMKFGLRIVPSLKEAIIKYRGGLSEVPMSQVKKQVNEMLNMDPKIALDLLTEHKLLPILPLSKLMMQELAKHRMVQHLMEEQP